MVWKPKCHIKIPLISSVLTLTLNISKCRAVSRIRQIYFSVLRKKYYQKPCSYKSNRNIIIFWQARWNVVLFFFCLNDSSYSNFKGNRYHAFPFVLPTQFGRVSALSFQRPLTQSRVLVFVLVSGNREPWFLHLNVLESRVSFDT